VLRPHHFALLATAALIPFCSAAAQHAKTAPEEPPRSTAPIAGSTGEERVYTTADFARFAPKNAYDMLKQVPGFSIKTAEEQRGLGQASENVLVNGQRIANKQTGAVGELQRIPASNVERIEIVDAASLGIAGLAGQVANVVVKAAKKASGQFEWTPDFRAHFAKPRIFAGSASYNFTSGPIDTTLSVKADTGRGGFGGEILIFDGDGVLTETRNETYHSEYDPVELQAKFGIDGPGSSVGNLSFAYTPYWNPGYRKDRRFPVAGGNRTRITESELDGWKYDINGDYEFAVGLGRLKLIGLRHFNHEPLVTTQILSFENGDPSQGTRFGRDTRIGETIGRAEYGWVAGKNNWQVTLERAFNSLDQKGKLETLNTDGDFVEQPFPEGTGKVEEVRWEAMGTLSRPLSSNLDLQIAGGAEISRLERVDGDLPARKFFRPKGSLTLGWRPSAGWDTSIKLRRKVGQISFYDFLAQPNLSSDRENAGNPDLVPPQSWEVEGEVGRELGAWGKTRLRVWRHWVEDIVDYIPLADHGQGVGNLPKASRWGAESVSTIQFDPIGWTGAKLDATLGFERTEVEDPLTGEKRPISSTRDRWVDATIRHDIPKTEIAWGVTAYHGHYTKTYFLTEVYRSWEGPWWLYAFIEHKNVFGTTVRVGVDNLLNARHRWTRFIYADWRDTAPLATIQRNNQLIGPIFSFSVKGTF
jgi:hypothetical protein